MTSVAIAGIASFQLGRNYSVLLLARNLLSVVVRHTIVRITEYLKQEEVALILKSSFQAHLMPSPKLNPP